MSVQMTFDSSTAIRLEPVLTELFRHDGSLKCGVAPGRGTMTLLRLCCSIE